ncbi:glycosyl transferase [Lentibacillus kapialis]|uniref:Glycosyl transferase n=1 Tax=Lentibacillus kapialis TaxID=340214 RepID=A0A917V036_9BACI|nr:glycosyltransferase family 4 protein [Lentibacillus kapialis]GGK05773.1 glycosyl transferase [Lentibacillus kapialis]
MKIIQFITHMHELGGAQMHVYALSKALKSSGHEVTVIGSGSCELTEELTADGIPYIPLRWLTVPIKPTWDLRAFFEARRIIKKIHPAIVCIHSSKAGIIGRLAAGSLSIPVIFTAHSWSFSGELSPRKKAFFTYLERQMGKTTDGIITVSHHDFMQAIEKKIAPRRQMQLIHNGIPDNERRIIRAKNSYDPVKLLMVARFAEPKNHRLLLISLSRIKQHPWHLTLVGDGPLLEASKKLAEDLDIRDQVTFTGEDRNIVKHMNEADIFLLISQSEGLPLSIIEAMREGLPVIASDVGGVDELITHRRHGLLVAKGSEGDLTAALHQLITNNYLRDSFGNMARQTYEKSFTFSRTFEQTENYYKEIVNRRLLT